MEGRVVIIGYLGRVLVYASGAAAGSMAGAMFTWTNTNWVDANPLTAGPTAALFSLGPAIAVVAIAPVRKSTAVSLALGSAAAMIAMWWAFASSGSSTAALVFLWGWFIGIPAAVAVVIARDRLVPRAGFRCPPANEPGFRQNR